MAEAERLASETYEMFKDQRGEYGNSPAKHRLGKLAEIGVEKALRSAGLDPDPAFRDIARWREPDLRHADRGLEVKSWRPDTWPELGRCVTPNQARAIAGRAEGVVWAIVSETADEVCVEIAGWSTPEDIEATEPRLTGGWRQVLNHQVELHDVRQFESLIETLVSGP